MMRATYLESDRRTRRLRLILVLGGTLLTLTLISVALASTSRAELVIGAPGTGETVGPYRVRRAPSLTGAIAALGRPSTCRVIANAPLYAVARWPLLHLQIKVGSLGGFPNGKNACSAPTVARVSTVTVFSSEWRTTAGLHILDRVPKLRRLYPQARLHSDGWWLISKSSPLRGRYGVLVARAKRGVVIAFDLHVYAEGD
jgi:hypothetical protein